MAPLALSELVELFTPTTSLNIPYNIPSGTVMLFTDASWTSGVSTEFNLVDYVANQRHVIPASQYNKATWVLWNLPIGTVVTLTANITNPVKVADLKGNAQTLDLIGRGRTQGTTLVDYNLNNQVSSWFWRTVDLNMGAIEIFNDKDFSGSRCTIFLSEWEPGKFHSLRDWNCDNYASSVRWRTLQDRQTATLGDAIDGSVATYSNIKGWGNVKEVPYLADVRFNNVLSSFKWESVAPMKEIIEPFNVTANNSSNTSGLTSVVDGINNSTEVQAVLVSLTNSTAQSITVETSDQHVAGISSTFSQEATAGVEAIASSKTTWSVSLNYSYTRTQTKSTSETKTVELKVEQTVNAPPRTRYKATLLINIGMLPATEYVTTA
ncbi:hypothetical protein GLAREA_06651 [Glarea lozoyensis ATCC 20868]|uniref:Uncharacterized protein n=1 Tax=Glarea lozoyensis (strain ATCC 20868 / MF5171) TaxID=1116229 RepID=S3E5G2_GLAL2|nr:uncharacterized protein GLAREA_06651 [Glarea lozoyensis ATCC 20868]EPE33638.1 hypothetical protein GLAREA_06651 [Glarea lozoyensis ATCC 20868]